MLQGDRLCGLVVGVPGYRSRSPEFDSLLYHIFSVVVGLEQAHSDSWVQLRSYLEETVAAPVSKSENTAVGIRRADYATPLYPQNLALKFADKRRSLSRYT
jgi:hypothetical protein